MATKASSFEEMIASAGEGKHEEKYGKMSDDEKKAMMVKDLGLETKADEVLSTINNTNWYEASGMKNTIKDLTPQFGQLLGQLSGGFEGSDLPKSYPVPYNVTDYYMQGKTQWEDEARPSFNLKTITDNKNTITQTSMILEFGVSDEMISYSTDAKLMAFVTKMITKALARTVEGMIINGDSEAGATGNINSDDQAPATTYAADGGTQYHATLLDNGLRETAINNSGTVDIGAFDSDDMIAVLALLGENYQEKKADLLWLFNPTTHTKAMADDGLKLAVNRASETALDAGIINKPWGIDLMTSELVRKTQADGKLSATGSNNTLGQFLLFAKTAVRWGYGRGFELEVERVQGYGFKLTATVDVGFTIVDRLNAVAAGINVTVA